MTEGALIVVGVVIFLAYVSGSPIVRGAVHLGAAAGLLFVGLVLAPELSLDTRRAIGAVVVVVAGLYIINRAVNAVAGSRLVLDLARPAQGAALAFCAGFVLIALFEDIYYLAAPWMLWAGWVFMARIGVHVLLKWNPRIHNKLQWEKDRC